MRCMFATLLWAAVAAVNAFGVTITYERELLGTSGGEQLFRYTYIASDVQFQMNQALEIEFDPTQYGVLSNPTAPAGFDVLVLQPNNPPGLPGVYSALAMTDTQAPLAGFGVDVTFLGPGLPGAQAFFINQFDSDGNFISTIHSGVTTQAGSTVIPEPGGLALAGVGLVVSFGWVAIQRRLRRIIH